MDEIIDVCCFVFPDGSTFWAPKADLVPKSIGAVVDAWKASIPEDQRALYAECHGAFEFLRMPRSAYLRIPATNQSAALAAAADL